MGNDPPQSSIFRHGRRSCAATCQIFREDGAIIDICMEVVGSIALFSLHARWSSLRQHSRQQARSSVLTITTRFVRCRQPNRCSLQPRVGSLWERGNSMLQLSGYPLPCEFKLHIGSCNLCAFFVWCVLGGKAQYFPDEF